MYLFLNGASPMTWGVWIPTLFIPSRCCTPSPSLAGSHHGRSRMSDRCAGSACAPRCGLKVAAGVLASATAGYTGLLLSVPPTFPLLNSGLLPVLFLVSALSTGLSAAVLGGSLLARRAGVALDLHQWGRCTSPWVGFRYSPPGSPSGR